MARKRAFPKNLTNEWEGPHKKAAVVRIFQARDSKIPVFMYAVVMFLYAVCPPFENTGVHNYARIFSLPFSIPLFSNSQSKNSKILCLQSPSFLVPRPRRLREAKRDDIGRVSERSGTLLLALSLVPVLPLTRPIWRKDFSRLKILTVKNCRLQAGCSSFYSKVRIIWIRLVREV